MRFLIISIWVVLLLGLTSIMGYAQPTDNPYRKRYNPVRMHWTDSLAWGNVVDVTAYGAFPNDGQNDLVAINKAIDAISLFGGGIVYFPAGNYVIEDNLQLKNGVIFRGETPTTANAKDSTFAPPSRLIFPKYEPIFDGNGTPNTTAFKTITCASNSNNIGLVHLDINRGGIDFNTDKGKNVLIWGIRSNNVAVPEPTVPSGGQYKWQRYCSRFAANIRVSVSENAVIANNRINDFTNNATYPVDNESYNQPGYLAGLKGIYIPVASPEQARFSYTDHHGISVNRVSANPFAEPNSYPALFRKGTEIIDNWIYKTSRVGIFAAGTGLIISRNVIRDEFGKKVYLTPQGTNFQTNNSATYENRGIDWSGWHVRIEDNVINVSRHTILSYGSKKGYGSIDGEGILIQECCGGTSVNGALIRNNNLTDAGYIGIYKMRDVFNVLIDSNNLGNNPIWVWANTNNDKYSLNSMVVEHNFNVRGISIDGSKGGSPSYVRFNQGNGKITAPCHVKVYDNQTFDVQPCDSVPLAYSEVRIVSPIADTTMLASPGNLLIRIATNSNTYSKFELWSGAKLISTIDGASNTFIWQVPPANGIHILTVKAFTSNGTYTWSKPLAVEICKNCLYKDLNTNFLKNNLLSEEIEVWPNPSQNSVNFKLNNAYQGVVYYSISNQLGQTILHDQLNKQKKSVEAIIDTRNLTSGVYWLKIKFSKNYFTKLIIKN